MLKVIFAEKLKQRRIYYSINKSEFLENSDILK